MDTIYRSLNSLEAIDSLIQDTLAAHGHMWTASEKFGTPDSEETDSCKLRRLTFDTLSLAAKLVAQEIAMISYACANTPTKKVAYTQGWKNGTEWSAQNGLSYGPSRDCKIGTSAKLLFFYNQ